MRDRYGERDKLLLEWKIDWIGFVVSSSHFFCSVKIKKVRETETRPILIHSCFENDSDGYDKSGIAHCCCAFPTVRPSCVLISNLCELRQTAQLWFFRTDNCIFPIANIFHFLLASKLFGLFFHFLLENFASFDRTLANCEEHLQNSLPSYEDQNFIASLLAIGSDVCFSDLCTDIFFTTIPQECCILPNIH